MNLKASKRGLKIRSKTVNPNYFIHCCVIGCHSNFVALGLNKTVSC